MKLLETAFWALKALKKSPAANPAPAQTSSEESNTEFISRTVDVSAAAPHWNKGLILERRGDKAGAMTAYREAIRLVPQYFQAHANLVRLLCETEQWDDAIKHGEMAIRLRRNSPKVHNNLSVAFYNRGQLPKALYHSAAAVQLDPNDPDLVDNLAEMRESHPELERSPMTAEARAIWMQVAEKAYDEAIALVQDKKLPEAVAALRKAVRIAPDWAEAMCQLASILATHPDDSIRNSKEAVKLAQKAMELGDGSPPYYDVLAAAYANATRFIEARETIEKILPTLKQKGPLEAAVRFAERHQLYSQRQPLRQEIPVLRVGPSRPGSSARPLPLSMPAVQPNA